MPKEPPYEDIQDVGDVLDLVTLGVEDSYVETEPIMHHPIVDADNADNNKLVVVLRANESDVVVQDTVREALAEQVAYLTVLRGKAADADLAAKAIITEKIVLTLKKVSELTTQRTKESKDKGGGTVDFHSESFQAVLGLLTERIMEAVKDTGMPEATTQRFFLKLKGKLMGFEDAAAAAYNGSGVSKKKQAAQNQGLYSK
jgi:hypothetical protein